MKGRVLKAHGGFYEVKTKAGMITCRLRGKNKITKYVVVPGDLVEVTILSEQEGIIDTLLKRRNSISRPPVANIDQMLIVAAHKDPLPDFLLLDRLIAIGLFNDIEPIICFNKEDLADDCFNAKKYYQSSGLRFFSISAQAPASLSVLKDVLKDKITVLIGNSGVGKSTLVNALVPESNQSTSAVSEKLHRGRHTTRVASFLPFYDGYLVDTPGFNALNLPKTMTPLELSKLYPEYLARVDNCKYNNCLHANEPGCAVKDAITDGVLSQERYNNYLILLEEVNCESWRG